MIIRTVLQDGMPVQHYVINSEFCNAVLVITSEYARRSIILPVFAGGCPYFFLKSARESEGILIPAGTGNSCDGEICIGQQFTGVPDTRHGEETLWGSIQVLLK